MSLQPLSLAMIMKPALTRLCVCHTGVYNPSRAVTWRGIVEKTLTQNLTATKPIRLLFVTHTHTHTHTHIHSTAIVVVAHCGLRGSVLLTVCLRTPTGRHHVHIYTESRMGWRQATPRGIHHGRFPVWSLVAG